MLDQILVQNRTARRLRSLAAKRLYAIRIRANEATMLGAILGVIAGVMFAWNRTTLGIIALLMAGALDALDGPIARTFGGPTAWGGVLDLTLDRVVEAAVLVGLVWSHDRLQFAGAIVLATWYVNITVFMATGAALDATEKLIHYPPGLVERTEALIFFVLVALFSRWDVLLFYTYAALEAATAVQRMVYAARYLRIRNA
jgi:phosphatidylglycerophosphate synthase